MLNLFRIPTATATYNAITMNTCGARLSPSKDQVCSSLRPSPFPPTPIDITSRSWRISPHQCPFAQASHTAFTHLDTPVPPDSRAKSTPPSDQHRQPQPVYPSPPLTDAALASTIPLPDVSGETFHKQDCAHCREEGVDENMSHDGARHIAPLSPPPTVLVGTSELPQGSQFEDEGHQIESWRYGEDLQDGGATAPLFPPVRDDSGFEEFGSQGGCEDDRTLDGSQGADSLIEPTSVWIPHSPLSMEEGLQTVDLPSLHGALPNFPVGSQSSGHSDALVSSVSPTGMESNAESWIPSPLMDWSPSNTLIDVTSPPSSPKPSGLSLELDELDSSLGFHTTPLQQPSPLSPVEISFGQHIPHWFQGKSSIQPFGEPLLSNEPTPLAEEHDPFIHYPHSSLLHPQSTDVDSEFSDTIMPLEDDGDAELPLPSPRRQPLNDLYDPTLPHGDIHLTPVPRSPHSNLLPLADLDMYDASEPPGSPHSPHSLLPELEGEDLSMFPEPAGPPMDTIAPSLLGGAPEPQAGLGLFLQSDPPLARSPSPDEDDFGFLDIQLDPESANVEIDEFLALRALRKNALAQERAARMAEAELGERITATASALLPPSHVQGDPDAMQMDSDILDPAEKRIRKRELHSLMDMRAEARRTRKLQKQRSKEIGALLDFKMHSPMSPMEGLPPLVVGGGKGWTKTIAHLVAHMVLRRRDRSRPLENKATGLESPLRRPTSLRHSISADDLLLSTTSTGSEEDEDDDMEM
ncbi:hypothetical protein BD311DRAFT_756827 [Dichomitus squalens]|uniref:Uncharacterized protein n=1 Tax=Dichomitus squalens TaxID=114155 RepID=A0A4Q9MQF9_9APHY|nr:hypothetical protein BD311DRAFT_756827 [Dichomitus squalens]